MLNNSAMNACFVCCGHTFRHVGHKKQNMLDRLDGETLMCDLETLPTPD